MTYNMLDGTLNPAQSINLILGQCTGTFSTAFVDK